MITATLSHTRSIYITCGKKKQLGEEGQLSTKLKVRTTQSSCTPEFFACRSGGIPLILFAPQCPSGDIGGIPPLRFQGAFLIDTRGCQLKELPESFAQRENHMT